MRPVDEKRWIAAALILAAGLIVLPNLPFLRTYAVSGDDYGVLHHSARHFMPSAAEWVTEGFANYFVHYDELGTGGTPFIRPVLNLSVFAESWLAADPESRLFLLTNYLGHLLCGVLVYAIARKLADLPPGLSLLSSILFSTSLATHNLFNSVAFRGDMLGAMFGLGALLAIHSALSHDLRPLPIIGAALLLLFAVFSKESSFSAPFVAVVYFLGSTQRRPHGVGTAPISTHAEQPRMRAVVTLGLVAPLLIAAGWTTIVGRASESYVIEDRHSEIGGIPVAFLNPVRFGLSAFFPIETETIKELVSLSTLEDGSVIDVAIIRTGVAVVVNAGLWGCWVYLLLRRSRAFGRLLSLGVLGVVAGAVPITLKADPRFMYFSQALFVPLAVCVVRELCGQRASSKNALAGWCVPLSMLAALGLGPAYFFFRTVEAQPGLVEFNRVNKQISRVLRSRMERPSLRRIYLVNDGPGMGGLAKLRFYAALTGRTDLRVRLVNQLARYDPRAETRSCGVRFVPAGNTLQVIVEVPRAGDLFGYLEPEDALRLGDPGFIRYGPIRGFGRNAWGKSVVTERILEFWIPQTDIGDYSIVGLDPCEPGVHFFEAGSQKWMLAMEENADSA